LAAGTKLRARQGDAWCHLAFAFESLGALEALSCAFYDNAASLATSASLGYEPNGETLELRRGVPDRLVNLRLTKDRWDGRAHPDVRVEGLDACTDSSAYGARTVPAPTSEHVAHAARSPWRGAPSRSWQSHEQ